MSASQSFIDTFNMCEDFIGPLHDRTAWFCRCNECLNDFVTACVEAPNPDDALRLTRAIETLRRRRQMTAATARGLHRRMRQAHRPRPLRSWRNVPGSYRSPPSPGPRPPLAERFGSTSQSPIVIEDDDDSQEIVTNPVTYTRVTTVIRRIARPDLNPVVYIEEMTNDVSN
jgi:hypothetical protein